MKSPLVAILTALAVASHAAETKPKPEFQYKSEGIEVPAATADEPRVKAFGADTIKAAVKYLDDGAHHWVREKSCIACHSTGVYMVERSALTALLGKPSEEVLAQFTDSVPNEGAKPDGNAIRAVWRSSGLASWDRHVEGKLREPTDRSLRYMMLLLTDDGFFRTIKQVEIPYITTHFELTVQAARAITTAPGWLENLKDVDLLARVERMKKFLREHEPVNDYELALKLQLAVLMPDLVPPPVRHAATAMLWRMQQPDGGWSTRRMSDLMKWHETMDPKVVTMIQGEPDAASPASDPYMTAFAIVLLRESGVPIDDTRIQKGVAWLKVNQRVSGRWWMKSLYRDTYHYITYISTAQALRALALCGELSAQTISEAKAQLHIIPLGERVRKTQGDDAPAWIANGKDKLPKLQRVCGTIDQVRAVFFDSKGAKVAEVADVFHKHTDVNELLGKGDFTFQFYDKNGKLLKSTGDLKESVTLK